jgi:hypothetical protein
LVVYPTDQGKKSDAGTCLVIYWWKRLITKEAVKELKALRTTDHL